MDKIEEENYKQIESEWRKSVLNHQLVPHPENIKEISNILDYNAVRSMKIK